MIRDVVFRKEHPEIAEFAFDQKVAAVSLAIANNLDNCKIYGKRIFYRYLLRFQASKRL